MAKSNTQSNPRVHNVYFHPRLAGYSKEAAKQSERAETLTFDQLVEELAKCRLEPESSAEDIKLKLSPTWSAVPYASGKSPTTTVLVLDFDAVEPEKLDEFIAAWRATAFRVWITETVRSTPEALRLRVHVECDRPFDPMAKNLGGWLKGVLGCSPADLGFDLGASKPSNRRPYGVFLRPPRTWDLPGLPAEVDCLPEVQHLAKVLPLARAEQKKIRDGEGRHAAFMRELGRLSKSHPGLSMEALVAQMRVWSQERLDPPYSELEITEKCRSSELARNCAAAPARVDGAMWDWVQQYFEENSRYHTATHDWDHTTRRWGPPKRAVGAVFAWLSTRMPPKAYKRLGVQQVSTTVKEARKLLEVRPMDQNPTLVGVPGGRVWDLTLDTLRPAEPEDYVSLETAASPADEAEYAASRWVRFVDEVACGDPDKLRLLRMMAGAALTTGTGIDTIQVLYGKALNGKSTFLRALAGAWGSYGHQLEAVALQQPNYRFSGDITGARLLVIADLESEGALNEGNVKRLTEAGLKTRYLYHEEQMTVSTWQVLAACNQTPKLPSDTGSARRFRFTRFERTFAVSARDTKLPATLKRPSEQAAMLRWAYLGYQDGVAEDWQPIRGFDLSDEDPLNEDTARAYGVTVSALVDQNVAIHGSDSLRSLLWEVVERDPQGKVATKDLYDRVRAAAAELGLPLGNTLERDIGRLFREAKGPEIRKSRTSESQGKFPIYIGVRFREV